MNRQRGFTLLEVVVALAILATALYGGLSLLHNAVRNTQYLQDSMLAHWVAMNAVVDLELRRRQGEVVEEEERQVTQYGVAFVLSVKREKDPDPVGAGAEPTADVLSIAVARADQPAALLEELALPGGTLQ